MWNLVEDTIARWRSGEPPDAAGFFARHPEVGARKSLALDLIHEELCLRREAGDTVVASTFVARFPAYRSSVVKMLAVEQYGEANPGFAESIGESLWPQPGQQFQGFEIVEPLGRGALARVYLARETDMGRRPVVVKVSQHGGHEAHLLGKLEHDNIVAAHSVKHDPETGLTVICMPLLGTATGLDLLDAAFRKENLPPATAAIIGQTARRYQPAEVVNEEHLKEAAPFARRSYVEGVVWIGEQLAQGLAAANALGIVHRDIKPSNVLLAWSGRPMLLDFNLSWGIDQEGDRVGGTVAYMAPERITALLADQPPVEEGLDPRPDIFSLGVVIYELLTGRLPVQPMAAEGSDEASLRKWLAARSQPIAPPSQLNREVDAVIDRIVLRSLSVEPTQRFATAADLAAELAAYLGPSQRAARWARRHRRRLLLSAAVTALALGAGGAYWATRPPYHEVQYQEGLRFHNAGNYLDAIRAYDKALADEPNSVQALSARGQSYYRKGLRLYDAGDHAGAIDSFTHSLADEPQSVQVLFARGQSYYWNGDYPSAQKDYLAAAAIEDRAIFLFCAACCAPSDASAADYLATALKLGHDESEVYCNLGVYYSNRNPRTAVESFRGAIAKNDRLRVAYVELANALYNELSSNGQALGEAVKCAEKAIELGARSKRLYLLATMLHLKAGASNPHSRQQAEECCRQWLAHGGDPERSKTDPLLGPLVEKLKSPDSGPPLAPSADQDDLRRGVLPPKTADLSRLP